jgi:hypothetical protein
MVAASSVDAALLEAAQAARAAERRAKDERAKAMDAIVDLLFERAALRLLLRQVVEQEYITAPQRITAEEMLNA